MAIGYHVYANTGVGDPINYTTPIGTTNQLSYTTGSADHSRHLVLRRPGL